LLDEVIEILLLSILHPLSLKLFPLCESCSQDVLGKNTLIRYPLGTGNRKWVPRGLSRGESVSTSDWSLFYLASH